MKYFVYILRCRDGSLYTGIAKDLKKRLAMHRAGAGAKYLRGRLPVRVVYQEKAASHSAALKREIKIKRLSRKEKLSITF